MSLLTYYEEAQIAQELVATVLAGALHAHGSQKALAGSAGVSPVFINNIIKGKRMPSLKMAAALAPLLPLAEADRCSWLMHVEAHHAARRQLHQTMTERVNDDALAAVQAIQAHRLSTFSIDPVAVRRGWALALDMGQAVALRLTAQSHAHAQLDLCDVMFEAYSMLGRHVDALWTVRRMQWIMTLMDEGVIPTGAHFSRLAYDVHKVNALRLEMVALIEMGLCKQALKLSSAIEAEPAYRRNPVVFKSILTWDKLNAMQHIPRASLREARHITHEAWRVSEKIGDDWQPLAQMLVARSFANLCLSRGHAYEAHAVLAGFLPTLDRIPHCGAFHKVLFLRAWARSCWVEQEWDEWHATINAAAHLAQQAGLVNELDAIDRERGFAHTSPP